MHRYHAQKIYGTTVFVFVVLIAGLVWYVVHWRVFVVYLVAVNSVTFFLYFWDKLIASTTLLRVPEVVLQLLAFAGGSPAGLLAQKLFRHKTQKMRFQILFWIIILAQVSILGYFSYLQREVM